MDGLQNYRSQVAEDRCGAVCAEMFLVANGSCEDQASRGEAGHLPLNRTPSGSSQSNQLCQEKAAVGLTKEEGVQPLLCRSK